MKIALTRGISPAMNRCELTYFERTPIDLSLAQRQHEAYQLALAQLGYAVHCLPIEPDLPDSVFVEDCAVVTDEAAWITRPGAESRRAETAAVAQALSLYRQNMQTVQAPGVLDGGDVLRVGKRFFVGLSNRSNLEAVRQMREFFGPWGYTVEGVTLTGCLHLKSAVTQVGENLLLMNPAYVDAALFAGYRLLEVDPREPHAANAACTPNGILFPTGFPYTLERLRAAGLQVLTVDATEVAKAEGAVTCCSILFEAG
jgi:dimethylargininase